MPAVPLAAILALKAGSRRQRLPAQEQVVPGIAWAQPAYPALYLSNGLYDAYGNLEENQQFADLAGKRGVETEWHPLYSGHRSTDAASLAAFLSP